MLPRIFIGGTGRSGTGILHKALGCHKAIYALEPGEMRFLVDPDGLINLLDALTVRYSIVQAREALFKFERLMQVYLTIPQIAPYKGYNLAHSLGGEYYWQRLYEFCSELVEAEFSGTDLQVNPADEVRLDDWGGIPARLTLSRTQLKIVKYFPDKNRLFALAAAFVDDLFLHSAYKRGKQTWCEKTPLNLLHIDFLWELFPESVFIHIKRDPRGVVHL